MIIPEHISLAPVPRSRWLRAPRSPEPRMCTLLMCVIKKRRKADHTACLLHDRQGAELTGPADMSKHHSNPSKEVLLLFPLYRWEDGGRDSKCTSKDHQSNTQQGWDGAPEKGPKLHVCSLDHGPGQGASSGSLQHWLLWAVGGLFLFPKNKNPATKCHRTRQNRIRQNRGSWF